MWTSVLCTVLLVSGIQANPDTEHCGEKDRKGQNDEGRLLDDLFVNYNRDARPVNAFNDKIPLSHGMSLISIDSLDDDTDDVTISGWEKMTWKDSFLKWEPSEYGGVNILRVPVSYLWTPDVSIYTNQDVDVQRSKTALVVISPDGTVLWIPQVKVRTKCVPTGKTYACSLKYGSWTYDTSKIDINFYDGLEDIDVADYMANRKFELESHSAEKHTKKYACCEELYADLTYSFTVKAK